jgi:thiol-disulfide isomerase/thioredoxin
MGTWCPDCAREVPKCIKTLELANNLNITSKMLALDRSKKDKEGLTEQYYIERIPTFVFLVEGNEIGRIVEKVEMSFEEDMATLLADIM